ncbi:ankyrin repeat domain-containing protein 45 isoform X4 [Acanthopagrus latus]|nr:ankyrin repeat domain-containing protein 45 isoform X4 [Acanthopagrus latus]
MTSIQKEIFDCVLCGDLDSIKAHFEREGFAEETQEQDLFGLKDEGGRNALLTACMLERSDILRELVRHGAQVDVQTVRGYSSLHLAACWGHLETVRTLLELGADTKAKTFRGERPVDLARRYSKTDCADCLLLAECLHTCLFCQVRLDSECEKPNSLRLHGSTERHGRDSSAHSQQAVSSV